MTDKAEYTPGPWSLYEPDATEYPTRAAFAIYTPQGPDPGRMVATVWHKDKISHAAFNSEAEANARLIVAAPELLEAIELALQYIENHSHNFVPTERQSTHVPSEIRAAIAKARGEAVPS